MVKNPSPAYKGLLLLSLLFSIGAVLTLIPRSGATYPNLLGYESICTFAPIATALCAFLAGLTCVIRSRFISPRPRAGKNPAVPVLVLLMLLITAAAFTPSYVRWKVDELSSATLYQD